ncbi:SLAC1 anion channel family protein [Hydrocarboniphaga effusa]|uniref:SLAC1 anion channel family protein n=1 Tax=Hydrocarboniphaga effusa TaxID=243629 RepID=UPI0035ADECC4
MQQERPLLARLSIAMFGMVMGVGGLANAWSSAHQVFAVPELIGEVLLVLALAIFAVLVCVHVAKLLLQREAVVEEFRHPLRSSFFPAVSVASMVLSVGLRTHSEPAAQLLWWFGAGLHLLLALTLIRRWIMKPQDESILTPAWFIPVVGNIFVPLGGVPLGHVEISWFFFSVGLVLWVAFFPIVLHRVLFAPALSERSVPTLFILLAPPSIGLSAILLFSHGVSGPLVEILYCFALFLALLLASLLRHAVHGPFFMSWWAMTFPVDGWAGAALAFHHARPSAYTDYADYTEAIAWLALIAATLIVCAVAWMTMRHLLSGKAFHED